MTKYERTGKRSGHCVKCGGFREHLHRDHIAPKWQGGTDDDSNIQYLCSNCHEDKSIAESRSPEFTAWQSLMNRLRWADPVFRKKTLEAMQGVPKTAETRKRMSETAKAHRATPEGKAELRRAVIQRVLNGKLELPRRRNGKKWTSATRESVMRGRSTPEAKAHRKAAQQESHSRPSCRESMKSAQQIRRERESQEKRDQDGAALRNTWVRRKEDDHDYGAKHRAKIAFGIQRNKDRRASLTPQQLADDDHMRAEKAVRKAERELAKLRLLVEQENGVEALVTLDTSKTVIQ